MASINNTTSRTTTKGLRSIAAVGDTIDDLRPALVVNRGWFETTIDHIRRKYGSVREYLRRAAGVDDEVVARLRANLLVKDK